MKLILIIDTEERFSRFSNMQPLIDMAVEELSEEKSWGQSFEDSITIRGKTGYLDGNRRKVKATMELTLTK